MWLLDEKKKRTPRAAKVIKKWLGRVRVDVTDAPKTPAQTLLIAYQPSIHSSQAEGR
jgi:hypothetical protein